MSNDPRGPERKIVKVARVYTPCTEGVILSLRVTLDCGHVRDPNPIYSYRVGDAFRCFPCGKER
jgi:hypothetical protein